jgi:hypothetical protein
MRIRAIIPATLTAALLVAPAAAEARTGPALKPFPIQPTGQAQPILSDGSRYVLIQAAPDLIRVYDVDKRSSYDLPVGKDCRLTSATPGVALLVCPSLGVYEGSWPWIIRLRTRVVEPAAGSDPQTSGERWNDIGRHWIGGSTTAAAHSVQIYLNWRTGERTSYPEPYELNGDLDLDDPGASGYPDRVFDRDGPLTLEERFDEGHLWLGRPGPDARLSPTDRLAWGNSTQLSAGLVTWREPNGFVRAYDTRQRLRLGWATGRTSAYVMHTRKHVLVATDTEPRLRWARVRK